MDKKSLLIFWRSMSSILLVLLILNVGRNSQLLRERERSDRDQWIEIEATKMQVPGIAKYMMIVKEIDLAAKDKLSAYEITEIAKIIIEQCHLNSDIGLTPALILAIIERESNFDPDVVSYAHAYGLMQIIETTWAIHADEAGYGHFTKEIALDPIVNVQIGVKELIRLRKYWLENEVDSWMITVNSYFWGTTNVWTMLNSKKRGNLPSLEYGKGIIDLAKKWRERGV